MNIQQLRELLFSMTESELNYQQQPKKSAPFFQRFDEEIPTFNLMNAGHNNKFFANDKRSLFKNSTIEFVQHTRFSNPPLHKHDHIEMTYVYRGSCKQVFIDKTYELTEGDFCLLDSNIVHTLYEVEEEDIIINIVLQKQFFTDSFLNRLSEHSILSQFIIQALSENQQENFLLFRSIVPQELHGLMEQMLIEYFRNDSYTAEMLKSYLFLFLTTLIRRLDHVTTNERFDRSDHTIILPILKYIADHAADCTLQHIADLFGYHPNYISKLLKDHTGSSYQELVVAQKIKKAKYLLSYTDETIQNIAEEVGYHNLSFFYKKFYTQTQMTPRDYRLASQQRLETMSPHSDQ